MSLDVKQVKKIVPVDFVPKIVKNVLMMIQIFFNVADVRKDSTICKEDVSQSVIKVIIKILRLWSVNVAMQDVPTVKVLVYLHVHHVSLLMF